MGDESNQKGRALEDAVALIEKAILETHPDLANRKMRIEVRKRVVVADVPHEIDLWVQLDGPHGYDSLFGEGAQNPARAPHIPIRALYRVRGRWRPPGPPG